MSGEDHADPFAERVDAATPNERGDQQAGLTVRRNNMAAPMAISTSPKTATHMVASCDKKFAMWFMVDATTVGCPTAIDRIKSPMKAGFKIAGWNFKRPSKIQMTPSATCSERRLK